MEKPFILTFGSCGWDRIFKNDSDGNQILIYEEEGRKNSHQALAVKRAGDTFIGYFIAFYCLGMEKIKCIRIGQCASSLEIQKMGVLNAIPFKDDVIEVYNRIYN